MSTVAVDGILPLSMSLKAPNNANGFTETRFTAHSKKSMSVERAIESHNPEDGKKKFV